MIIEERSKNIMCCIYLLLQNGANPSLGDINGITPLNMAVQQQCYESIQLLLKYHADPNVMISNVDKLLDDHILRTYKLSLPPHKIQHQISNDWTALHVAAYNSSEAFIAILLQHNANPNIQNNYGYTPLHLAVWRHSEASDIYSNNQLSMDDISPPNYHETCIRLLLQSTIDPDILDNTGHPAKYYATNSHIRDLIESYEPLTKCAIDQSP